MLNRFCKKPLYEVTSHLAAVAAGARKADLVIKNVRLVNVCTAEIEEHKEVAVAEGRIALVGDASHCIGEHTKVIDGEGQYLAPGFMDGHTHVESSMLTVSEYSRSVLPHGTTAVFMDPHEICNVCGKEGVKAMIEDAGHTPLKVMSNAPSCVPAVPGFEDTGASISPEDIREMMRWEGIMGLGEMMNYPGVIGGDENVHAILAETLKADQIITGHFPAPDTGKDLNAYIAAGARSCHESARAEDVLEKMRRGIYAQIRYGTAWRDLAEVLPAILDHPIDDRFACLVTDDVHADTLARHGHMDHILRLAINRGLDPVKAIQFVTINTASCFRMEHELGSIAPGKCADMVFFADLQDIRITRTIIDGEVVAEKGKLLAKIEPSAFPEEFYHSMHVGEAITPESFLISAPDEKVSEGRIRTRVIGIIPERAGTTEETLLLPVTDGNVAAAPELDVIKMAVFERHHETGTKGIGFVKGLGIHKGAIAQTVAHDAHNLLVAGTDDEDMALAANTLMECGGGLCAVLDGEVLSLVKLPIAGLISDAPVEEVAGSLQKLEKVCKELGSKVKYPYITMAILPLACIPELRLTNRGLVDCRSYRFVELFE